MLRTDLIELINRSNMWAFVGSGASVEAGCPSWGGLAESIVTSMDDGQEILKDDKYLKAFSKKRFATCFSKIENLTGRETLVKQVAAQIESVKSPGRILRLLADWPFAGYVTTNYDGLLEVALRETGEYGWLPIGNSQEEVRKVSGDAQKLIWHIHGGIGLKEDKSRLVLTEEDYDSFYLDSSPMVSQLRALLGQRRVLFIGFGFEDNEVIRLLKMVGRLCSPARPAFALLSGLSGTEHEVERIELLKKYNVDVIPYRVFNGSHNQLFQFLEVYSALVLRRSLRFGQPERVCPSYDPETTGLMIYNQFALRHHDQPAGEILESLLKSRILALLKYRGPSSIGVLVSDLAERVRLVQGVERSKLFYTDGVAVINKCLSDLKISGLVELPTERTPASIVSLSSIGLHNLEEQSAKAKRLSEQFSATLHDRARGVSQITQNPGAGLPMPLNVS